jgi:hypothetical protein
VVGEIVHQARVGSRDACWQSELVHEAIVLA